MSRTPWNRPRSLVRGLPLAIAVAGSGCGGVSPRVLPGLGDAGNPGGGGGSGSDGGGARGDDGGIDPGGPSDNCGVQMFMLGKPVTPDLLIIQDRSGSMSNGASDNRNPPPGQSKWELMRAGLEQVVAAGGGVDWGLMLFSSDGSCGVPNTPDVPVGANTGARIKQVLDAASPGGSTPTTAAMNSGLAWYGTLHDNHPHFLLLATDGMPTCGASGGRGGGRGNDDVAAEAAVTAAAAAGVHTFVVGIGSNTGADATLTAMANNGLEPNTTAGQPAYFPATSTQDLVNVLQSVAGKIISCEYALSKPPSNPDLVTVEGSAGRIDRDTTHASGWDFGTGGVSIVFYGDTCHALQSGSITDVQAVFGCPPIM